MTGIYRWRRRAKEPWVEIPISLAKSVHNDIRFDLPTVKGKSVFYNLRLEVCNGIYTDQKNPHRPSVAPCFGETEKYVGFCLDDDGTLCEMEIELVNETRS